MNKTEYSSELPLLARRLAVELDAYGRAFATEHNLNPTEMRALVIIMDGARNGRPVSPKQLSHELYVTLPSVTALLDRLEDVGHVHRIRHPSDRRSIMVYPGDDAMRLGAEFFGSLHAAMVTRLCDGLTQVELTAAHKAITLMLMAVESEHTKRLA